jgi:hypothetical protein
MYTWYENDKSIISSAYAFSFIVYSVIQVCEESGPEPKTVGQIWPRAKQ